MMNQSCSSNQRRAHYVPNWLRHNRRPFMTGLSSLLLSSVIMHCSGQTSQLSRLRRRLGASADKGLSSPKTITKGEITMKIAELEKSNIELEYHAYCKSILERKHRCYKDMEQLKVTHKNLWKQLRRKWFKEYKNCLNEWDQLKSELTDLTNVSETELERFCNMNAQSTLLTLKILDSKKRKIEGEMEAKKDKELMEASISQQSKIKQERAIQEAIRAVLPIEDETQLQVHNEAMKILLRRINYGVQFVEGWIQCSGIKMRRLKKETQRLIEALKATQNKFQEVLPVIEEIPSDLDDEKTVETPEEIPVEDVIEEQVETIASDVQSQIHTKMAECLKLDEEIRKLSAKISAGFKNNTNYEQLKQWMSNESKMGDMLKEARSEVDRLKLELQN